MAIPVTPVRALTPCWNLLCLCVSACCLCGLGGPAEGKSMARCRRDLRRPQTGSGGRNALARRPKVGRRCIPGHSWTSRLGRPRLVWTWCGSTRSPAQPRVSSSSKSGSPETPVAARATGVMPPRAHQAAQASKAAVDAPQLRTGWGASRGGTATPCASAPLSMPAACRVPAASGGGRAGGACAAFCLRGALIPSTRAR